MKIAGIQWDDGNWPKCGKHGVAKDEIENALWNIRSRSKDPHGSEERYRTIWKSETGRHVFIVFTYRSLEDGLYARPISARYMHEKEVEEYG